MKDKFFLGVIVMMAFLATVVDFQARLMSVLVDGSFMALIVLAACFWAKRKVKKP